MKEQGKAKIISLEINDKLKKSNEELNLHRATLTFCYNSEGDESDGIQGLLQSLDTRNSQKTLLVELGENKLSEMREKLVNKTAIFTTYTLTISEALKGTKYEGATAVHNDERTYTAFANSYIGKVDDKESCEQAIKDRIIRQLKEKTLYVGELGSDNKKNDDDD